MKKLLCILLMLIFCFGFLNVTAFAANEKIVVKAVPSATTLSRNDIFTVDFMLTSNAGFETLGLEISYDSDILEIYCAKHIDGKSCTSSRSPVSNMFKPTGYSNSATNSRWHTDIPYKIMWAFGNASVDVYYTGKIATLTFRVKKDAVLGKTSVFVAVDQASSLKRGAYTSSERKGINAAIDVACVNHKFGDWNKTKVPTCTEKGIETRICSICKKEENRDIQTIGHKMGKWEVTKESTCVEEGTQTLKCINSGCEYTETKKIPLKSHNMGEWSVIKEATCIQTGILSRKCTVCNKEEVMDTPKGSHKQQNPIVTLEPTCTEEGIMQGKCTVCGEKNTEEKIQPKGHSFGEPIVTKEATETETGIRISTCTVCGEKKQEEIPCIAPLPEDPKEPTESESESESQAITVITDNKDSGDTIVIFLLVLLIVVGLAATVISIIKIKKLK